MKAASRLDIQGAFRFGKPLFSWVRRAAAAGLRDSLDFAFPRSCLICGEGFGEGRWLCPACWRRVLESAEPAMHRDAEDFPYLAGEQYFDGLAACWEFNPDLEQIIHRIKYSGMEKLGRHLGGLAGRIFREAEISVARPDAVVPVPLHPVRRRERGYNQSERIAEGFAGIYGLPVRGDLIDRRRATKTQTGLTGEERQVNVSGAFRVRRPEAVRGLSLLVVDDVVTTGATLNACARALKEAGAGSVTGFALARPVLRKAGGPE
ncbi:MAG: ComF family protein [bacterium]|nr:ComF family protein [bacterium]